MSGRKIVSKRKAIQKRRPTNRRKPSTQLAKIEAPPLVHIEKHPVAFVSAIPSLQSTINNLEQIRRFVTKCFNVDLHQAIAKLEPGKALDPDIRKRLEVDWGTIPGVDKPFLMQPGAEKFLLWLNLRPKFVKRETELPGGHLEIVTHVVFYSKKTGEEVFEGPDCSCSTMESNYRFRWADSETKPPQADVDRLKQSGMGRFRRKAIWVRGKKTGEEYVWQERIENPNIYDERNKVRQIGEKRGLVKGVKNMGAMSELFNADPDEWNLPDEPTEDPRDAIDYTESGRRIVMPDGKTPSGRETTWEGSKQAAQKVAEEKLKNHAEGKPITTAAPVEEPEPQRVTIKVEERMAAATASVKNKVVEYYSGTLGDVAVLFFVRSEALAAMLDNGFAKVTMFSQSVGARYFVDDPGNVEVLEGIAKNLGFVCQRVAAPEGPKPNSPSDAGKSAPSPQSAPSTSAKRGPMAPPPASIPPFASKSQEKRIAAQTAPYMETEYVDPAKSKCGECGCSFGVHLKTCSKFVDPNSMGAKGQREAVSDRTASQPQTPGTGPQTLPQGDGAGKMQGILESIENGVTVPKKDGKPTGKPGNPFLGLVIDKQKCTLFDNKEMPMPDGSKKFLFTIVMIAKDKYVYFEAVKKGAYINLTRPIAIGEYEWEWSVDGVPISVRRLDSFPAKQAKLY